MSFEVSRTCPRFRDPSGRPTSTSSPYPTQSVFSTKISGPAISVIVRYSVGISGRPQPLELLVYLGEGLLELLVELCLVLHPVRTPRELSPPTSFTGTSSFTPFRPR